MYLSNPEVAWFQLWPAYSQPDQDLRLQQHILLTSWEGGFEALASFESLPNLPAQAT